MIGNGIATSHPPQAMHFTRFDFESANPLRVSGSPPGSPSLGQRLGTFSSFDPRKDGCMLGKDKAAPYAQRT